MTTVVAAFKRSRARPGTGLDDLDDGCILKIFSCLSPLPDLFHMSCSCKRFRDLTSDGRLWFSVGTGPVRPMQPPGMRLGSHVVGRGKHVNFASLQAAISASRPGDTIVLEAGQDHVAADVVIPWPLHLVGASARPEDTRIICPGGATSALDFRASGKVVNLMIQVEMGSCILHQKGRLAVEGCILTCKAGGLAHLFHPLVTTAVGAGPGHPTPPSAVFNTIPTAAAPEAQHIPHLISPEPPSSSGSLLQSPHTTCPKGPFPPTTPPLQTHLPSATSAVTPCSAAVPPTHSVRGTHPAALQSAALLQQPPPLPSHTDNPPTWQDVQQDPHFAACSSAGVSIRPSLPFAAMPPAPRSTMGFSQAPLCDSNQESAAGVGQQQSRLTEAGGQPLVPSAGRGLMRGSHPRLPLPVGNNFRGVGRLSVIETKIRGAQGTRAVRCCGSGTLQGVRTIHLSRDTLFWFQVDSAIPGTQLQSHWPPVKPHRLISSPHQPPSRLHSSPFAQKPGVDEGGTGGDKKGEWGSLDEKAESWRTSRHHTSRQPLHNVEAQA
ncbi:hypothetical protein WJX74_005476 [Apatococcus lobatus]|uniref:F-box domain-containing protein n=1 Tax=Apatococcus lobatus TaxID=904363 RepID=A0AAW1QBP4_9CHLO